MEYTLRRMTSADIFPMCTIIKKLGIEEIKKIMNSPELIKMVSGIQNSKKSDDEKIFEIGFNGVLDMAILIVGNIPKIETDLYKFLASMTKMTEKELREVSPADFLELIIAVIKHEDFKDFFNRASQLLK